MILLALNLSKIIHCLKKEITALDSKGAGLLRKSILETMRTGLYAA